jgi:hypothetical protein
MSLPETTQPEPIRRWLKSLSPALQLAWAILTPEEQAAEYAEYQRLVTETIKKRRKFALLAFREHHPKEVLNAPDYALTHGVSEKAYRGMRQRKEL